MTVTSRGMVTIPASIRKRYKLNDGDKLVIIEDEGTIRLIPLVPEDQLLAMSCSPREMIKMLDEDRQHERELDSI